MIQARAGGFAGDGKAAGMHQHAGFYAQRLGGFLERGLERPGVERGRGGKGVAEFFQARLFSGMKSFFAASASYSILSVK